MHREANARHVIGIGFAESTRRLNGSWRSLKFCANDIGNGARSKGLLFDMTPPHNPHRLLNVSPEFPLHHAGLFPNFLLYIQKPQPPPWRMPYAKLTLPEDKQPAVSIYQTAPFSAFWGNDCSMLWKWGLWKQTLPKRMVIARLRISWAAMGKWESSGDFKI